MTTAQAVPDLSVVIVSWNTKDLLLQCIRSVLMDETESGLSVETIVVDNASQDGTVDELNREFPPVSVIAQSRNLGFSVANNLGIERSRGACVLLLNPDTEIHPGTLKRLWNTLHAAAHVGMVAPVLENTDGSFQSAGYRFPDLTQTLLDLFPLHPRLVGSSLNGRFGPGDGLTPFRIDHPLGACMLVRREVIEEVGVFDPGYFIYSEEIDWCRRINAAGWTILCAPSARVTHHGGQSTSQTSDRMRHQLHQSRARYLRQYHSETFHRWLQMLITVGASLKRSGVPIPSGDLTADEITMIATIYRDAAQGAVHE